jgi:hypothetical protein
VGSGATLAASLLKMLLLLCVSLLALPALVAGSPPPLLGEGYLCQTCVTGMEALHHRMVLANSTAALCAKTWTADKCALAHAMNRTAFNECEAVVTKMCAAAAVPDGNRGHQACAAADFCGPNAGALLSFCSFSLPPLLSFDSLLTRVYYCFVCAVVVCAKRYFSAAVRHAHLGRVRRMPGLAHRRHREDGEVRVRRTHEADRGVLQRG